MREEVLRASQLVSERVFQKVVLNVDEGPLE